MGVNKRRTRAALAVSLASASRARSPQRRGECERGVLPSPRRPVLTHVVLAAATGRPARCRRRYPRPSIPTARRCRRALIVQHARRGRTLPRSRWLRRSPRRWAVIVTGARGHLRDRQRATHGVLDQSLSKPFTAARHRDGEAPRRSRSASASRQRLQPAHDRQLITAMICCRWLRDVDRWSAVLGLQGVHDPPAHRRRGGLPFGARSASGRSGAGIDLYTRQCAVSVNARDLAVAVSACRTAGQPAHGAQGGVAAHRGEGARPALDADSRDDGVVALPDRRPARAAPAAASSRSCGQVRRRVVLPPLDAAGNSVRGAAPSSRPRAAVGSNIFASTASRAKPTVSISAGGWVRRGDGRPEGKVELEPFASSMRADVERPSEVFHGRVRLVARRSRRPAPRANRTARRPGSCSRRRTTWRLQAGGRGPGAISPGLSSNATCSRRGWLPSRSTRGLELRTWSACLGAQRTPLRAARRRPRRRRRRNQSNHE